MPREEVLGTKLTIREPQRVMQRCGINERGPAGHSWTWVGGEGGEAGVLVCLRRCVLKDPSLARLAPPAQNPWPYTSPPASVWCPQGFLRGNHTLVIVVPCPLIQLQCAGYHNPVCSAPLTRMASFYPMS